MATNKDTENNSPSAPAPADNDIAKLTEIAEQDIDEAIEDEFGTIYSKDGKRLFEFNKDLEGNEDDLIIRDGTEIICDDAFSDCTYLDSLIIPPSVTSIGNRAFAGCSVLTSIGIPSTVTSIGDGAFENCYRLTSIEIPSSVTSIRDRAFNNCSSLNSITIPPSVRTMKGNPFKEWYGHIVTNSPYFKYENGALIDVEKGLLIAFCSTATSCTIPPSVKTIGYSAFFGCENLISITIPPSIKEIGSMAFMFCPNLDATTKSEIFRRFGRKIP